MHSCVPELLRHWFRTARLDSAQAICPPYSRMKGSYGVIECHLARANPHWKDVASGNEALMIFQGADGNWYPSKAQHGKVVPTWNYAVVHAYGRPEVMENKDWLHRHVGELTMQQEQTQ